MSPMSRVDALDRPPRRAGRMTATAFWLHAAVLALMMFAAGAPSPLYAVRLEPSES
jgi:hypothetical protein